MPPTRHSTSTAHKESDQIPSDQNYALGEYSFRIERTSVPGSTNDKIEAICTDKDGKNARKSIQLPSSTQLDGWFVEANGTEATVYAVEKIPKGGEGEYTSDLDTSPVTQPIPAGMITCVYEDKASAWGGSTITDSYSGAVGCAKYYDGNYRMLFAADSATSISGHMVQKYRDLPEPSIYDASYETDSSWTYLGKTVYYLTINMIRGGYKFVSGTCEASANPDGNNANKIAWTMIYGTPSSPTEYELKQVMVGRFAIDLEDAGGVGPGSDWTDPGDYDPDWEPDEPTHTLYVEVTGALSGRHNDPIEDPSYSYIPADKDTVKDYGCGGDGGHGGGGGAGASTVVVHKFATNQANNKEVTAIARRHGYGSGGGKGGKGGDGCILVYY